MIGGISHRAAFDRLRRDGTRARRGPLALTYVPGPNDRAHIAFAIPKRIGPAVRRNRCRRRVRAVLANRAERGRLAPGSYLVSINGPLDRVAPDELEQLVDAALEDLRRHVER